MVDRRSRLLFALAMAAVMVPVMTGVVTFVNIGLAPGFLVHWAQAFVIAYVVAVPMIYLFSPAVRAWVARLPGTPDAS